MRVLERPGMPAAAAFSYSSAFVSAAMGRPAAIAGTPDVRGHLTAG
ncbi:hypothetical protein [Streptomyces sp. NPDC059761]